MKERMAEECGTVMGRESAACSTVKALETLLLRVDEITCIVTERTSPLTRQEPSMDQTTQKPASEKTKFPPLFERIREITDGINRSLDCIEDVMRKLEL